MMPAVGVLSTKVDARLLIACGFVGSALALFSMTRFDADIDYSTIAWARVYQSLALALLFIPINTVALTGVPTEKSNNASAIINMMRNIGSSVGISLVTTLIARREQYHQNVLVEHVTPFSHQYDTLIQKLQQAYLAQSASAADALQHAQAQVYAMVQREAALLSYNDSFWALAVILVAMVPLVFLLRKPPPGAAQPQGH